MCVMEAVAYLAGEPWGDRPRCASSVIGALLRALNDAAPEDSRQALKAAVPWVVGTSADSAMEVMRSWMVMDWHVRTVPAAWLTLANCHADAAALAGAGEVRDAGTLALLLDPLRSARAAALINYETAISDTVTAAWDCAERAAGASPTELAVAEARRTPVSGRGGPPTQAACLAAQGVPARAQWSRDRTAAWHGAWNTTSDAASIAANVVLPAVVGTQAATASWGGGWDSARDLAQGAWDLALDLARTAARDAALAAGWRVAWAAAGSVVDPATRSIRVEAALAAMLGPTAATLQARVLALVRSMAELQKDRGRIGDRLVQR
jgi:hypothetical protein